MVSMTVNLRLESSDDGLTFPLPLQAENITMNGGNVLTVFGGGVCAGATVEGDVTIALAGGYLDKFVGGGICGAVFGLYNISYHREPI